MTISSPDILNEFSCGFLSFKFKICDFNKALPAARI